MDSSTKDHCPWAVTFFAQMFPGDLYEIALQKEFDLAYYKVGSVPDWQNMSVGERDWHYNKLVEVKNREKKEHEEQQAKLAAKTRSTRKK